MTSMRSHSLVVNLSPPVTRSYASFHTSFTKDLLSPKPKKRRGKKKKSSAVTVQK